MTTKVFYQDSYQQSHSSKLVSWIADEKGTRLILDSTIFYPMGGGQPGDSGTANVGDRNLKIIDTRYGPDRQTIEHWVSLENEPTDHDWLEQLEKGLSVHTELDWQRRHRLMRMHTAMHLLCAVIPHPVTGGGVGESESRVEFDMQTSDFDKEALSLQLNEFIRADLPVAVGAITDEELDENPALVRTMSVQPPRGHGTIRMIRIGEGLDYQPCGGTHVSSTGEIGQVAITKIKSKGKQNKRVNIALLAP